MRKNISDVIEAFKAGKTLKGPTCSTDGQNVFSYGLKIGERRADGSIWIHEANSTVTTNGQIRALQSSFPPPCSLHEDCKACPALGKACEESRASNR